MTTEAIKKQLTRLWILILKMWNSIKWFLSMLWPDKTISSRMCFGMAFVCIFVFAINAAFTVIYSCGLLINEMGHKADKELKMAKMICDREEQKSDTTTTDQLFKMIMDSGIDSTYTICITDSTEKIVACNRKGIVKDSVTLTANPHFKFNLDGASFYAVTFNNTMNICLSDTIANTDFQIKLIDPMDKAFNSAVDVVKKVGWSSLWCFLLLVICYLIMLFMLRRTTSRTKQIEGELDIAASIQKQMVPLDFSAFPERHGYDLHGMLQPAKTMGGDLLDYVLRDNKLFFCIGDVSGKGMPAALFMSEVHVLFHHILAFAKDPADICSAMNRSLAEGNDNNMFCTFFVGIVDFETNIMSYCNAGHNLPVLIDSNGKAEFVKVIPNIALGLIEEFSFQTQEMQLQPGTTLVTYTDGVTEAESLNKEVLGDNALLKALSDKHLLSPSDIITLIMGRINEHTVLADQSDDITMLVLKRNE